MTRSPKKLSKSLTELDYENPRADVLADVLSVALLRNVLYKRLEARGPWGLRVAFHERAVFYLIARGTALLEVDGERALSLSAGEAAFLPHGTAHTIRDSVATEPMPVCDGRQCSDSGTRRIGGSGAATTLINGFFELRGARPVLLERMPRVVVLSPADPASGSTSGPWISATIQLLLAENAAPGPASAMVQQRLADVLFVQALRSLSNHSRCKRSGLVALSDPPIHEALALMHARVAAEWTVESLAGKVGLSRSAFAARFHELVGEPPLKWPSSPAWRARSCSRRGSSRPTKRSARA